jgi:hypothetical protein
MSRTKTHFRDATAARHGFKRAHAPTTALIQGDWDIEFLAHKRWLDVLPRVQRVLGIHKLYGMRFEESQALHLLGKPKRNNAVKPMTVSLGASAVDGRPAMTLVAEAVNGKLWETFSAEIRVLDDDTLVGVDLIGRGDYVLPMPFLLHRREDDK